MNLRDHDQPLPQRIADKIEVGDCWMWQGSKNAAGYGHATLERKTYYAHRLIWTLLVGPIPEGLQVDHLCMVESCVNPDHLEPVTPKVNTRRSQAGRHLPAIAGEGNRRKTHCPQGHEYDGVNRAGSRICRQCKREATRRWRNRAAQRS